MNGRGLLERTGLFLALAFFLSTLPPLAPVTWASRASKGGGEGVSSKAPPGGSPIEAPSGRASVVERAERLGAGGHYIEAASLLGDAARGMESGPSRARLRVMEARFLALGKDYDGAIELYSAVLEDHPEMRAARLGLARTLAWKGLYGRAVVEYGKVLSVEPRDVEARLGLARTLAWKGDYRASAVQYRRVLSEHPASKEAGVGLGRTLWWMGRRRAAAEELAEVVKKDPHNTEARLLWRRVRLETGPLLGADFVVAEDSDSNHLEIYSLGASYSPVKGLGLNLRLSQFEASRLTERSRARSAELRLDYRPLEKTTVTARSAFLSLDTPSNPTTEATGGISFRQELPEGFRAGAGYTHYVLLDTARLIRNNIRLDEFFTYVSGGAYGVDFTSGIKYADYSDGNRRRDFFLDVSKGHEYYGIVFTLGYRLDYRDFSHDLNSGYFDPADFFAHTFYGRARGALLGGRIEYDALAGGGVQSFNSTSESTTKLSLQVKGRLTESIFIRGGAKYERSALASASGFRYEEYRAGIDYLF